METDQAMCPKQIANWWNKRCVCVCGGGTLACANYITGTGLHGSGLWDWIWEGSWDLVAPTAAELAPFLDLIHPSLPHPTSPATLPLLAASFSCSGVHGKAAARHYWAVNLFKIIYFYFFWGGEVTYCM